MDFMKRYPIILAAIFGMIAGAISASSAASYDVKVQNDTGHTVVVTLYVSTLIQGNKDYSKWGMSSWLSHTFTTDWHCPSGFKGTIHQEQGAWIDPNGYKLASTSILGHETGKSGFSPGCWNSSWKICRKRGKDGDPLKDDDYGFCKQ